MGMILGMGTQEPLRHAMTRRRKGGLLGPNDSIGSVVLA
jgi:hypothetical protein